MCKLLKASLLGVLIALAFVSVSAADRGVPASHGIGNFGQVDAHLYRGAQPDAIGVANLKGLGVKTIICLRMTNDLWLPERAIAESNGISFVNIPLPGLGAPAKSDMEKFLAAIEKSPDPVFVHCEHGCDRTGTVIACYRIRHDHWSAAEAQKEADHYGMSDLERGMRKFIVEFGTEENKKRQTAIGR
jgi:protein tyrosine/serine phosphatase